MKKESSTWAKENFDRRFTWQEGCEAFTVNPTAADSVPFLYELRELLNAARIEFDEKYLL